MLCIFFIYIYSPGQKLTLMLISTLSDFSVVFFCLCFSFMLHVRIVDQLSCLIYDLLHNLQC